MTLKLAETDTFMSGAKIVYSNFPQDVKKRHYFFKFSVRHSAVNAMGLEVRVPEIRCFLFVLLTLDCRDFFLLRRSRAAWV